MEKPTIIPKAQQLPADAVLPPSQCVPEIPASEQLPLHPADAVMTSDQLVKHGKRISAREKAKAKAKAKTKAKATRKK